MYRASFRLRLSNPDGALLGDREATGTIRNSDPVALSASFPASAYASASHSGAEDRPQAAVEFSEPVAEFAADTPSVSVTGGAVASVQPHTEDGLEHAWLFVLAPGGDDPGAGGGGGNSGAARQAQESLRHGYPRLGDSHLGRPRRRQHHRLRHPAAHSRSRPGGPVPRIGLEHGDGDGDLHR